MKIPEKATKVFSGILYDVYHWEQELYDGTSKTFEMLRRNAAPTVIPISEDGDIYILLQEQPGKKPYYSLPGGCSEDGENHADTIKRELLEETGLAGDDWKIFKIYNMGGKMEYEKPFYIAKNCKKIQEQTLDGGEKIEVMKVTWERFLEIVISPEFKMQEFAFDVLRYLYEGKEKELKDIIYK